MGDELTIELAPEEVARLIDAGAELIDVRTDEEYEAGHLADARHLPLADLSGEADSLPRDKPIVFYCRGGNRSRMAAEATAASGRDAHNMAGGIVAWAEQGKPLEPEDGEVVEQTVLPPA